MQGRGKREFPKKTRSRAASSSTIPTCDNPGANPPMIEPGSPRWEASAHPVMLATRAAGGSLGHEPVVGAVKALTRSPPRPSPPTRQFRAPLIQPAQICCRAVTLSPSCRPVRDGLQTGEHERTLAIGLGTTLAEEVTNASRNHSIADARTSPLKEAPWDMCVTERGNEEMQSSVTTYMRILKQDLDAYEFTVVHQLLDLQKAARSIVPGEKFTKLATLARWPALRRWEAVWTNPAARARPGRRARCCRPDVGEARRVWSSAGMQGRGKLEISEKAHRSAASSGRIPTCENPGATPSGNEPVSPWCEASSLITTPSWPTKFAEKPKYYNSLIF
ncbi:hypothetical protein PR048_028164 [Dryococelus australis]|uniref:Uncharacterized protein n=1 Tax=Dryococelus australis TaxID=614101 RepID=A0ABQ9GIJ1_9NEOP|nr:hypothetical protein PR048_028164 [Dryococelus australis]